MPEIQEIFQRHGDEYQNNHLLPIHVLKTMTAISRCRTSSLGSHVDVCEDCGNVIRISYNSCRNRHCPKCQAMPKERWVEARKSDLLNVGYFHVVLTIPDTLNGLAFQNQKAIYSIMFKAAAESITELASDKKYLGAAVGLTAVLHTWGQNLMHHPHIHCIVPGGGIDPLGKWKSSRKKFFLPVKVLSRKFRGKFMFYLKQASLEFFGEMKRLQDPVQWSDFLSSLYSKEWVVYCKPPFKSAACVVEYLGRYTHRVAISNSRILNVADDTVSFKWRDYKDDSKQKVMTLSAHEFIRRFLIHILPSGFVKIRHYGFLASRNKSSKLALCKALTHTPVSDVPPLTTAAIIEKLFGVTASQCPCCGSAQLSKIFCYGDSS